MLALNYRFSAQNSTGQTLAINTVYVKARRWNFSSTGAVVYESGETTICNIANTIPNNGLGSGAVVANSGDLFIGGDFQVKVTASLNSNGNVTIYYEPSTDGGSTFPSSGLGIPVAVLNFPASGTKITYFTL